MTACPAHNKTQLCPQRHTCELHRRYLEAGSGVVSLVSMPVSAGDGCYMYRPVISKHRKAPVEILSKLERVYAEEGGPMLGNASAGIREAVRISEGRG